MKKIIIFFLILLTAITFIPAFADDDDDNDDESSGVPRQQIFHVYDDVDLLPTTKMRYGKYKMVIKTIYPRLVSDDQKHDETVDAFNLMVQTILQDEVDQFTKQVADNQPYEKNLPKGTDWKNEMTIDFDSSTVNTTDNPLISVRFSIEGYTAGMAHPYHRHRVLNFNLGNGQTVELADLFQPSANYLQILADYSRKILVKRLKELNDPQKIEQGIAPMADNYKNWNLNPDGLLITFDEIQVAPYVYGAQKVLVPYAILIPIMAPNSPIAECLKRQKKCLNNHLLTGGFMEEAATQSTSVAM